MCRDISPAPENPPGPFRYRRLKMAAGHPKMQSFPAVRRQRPHRTDVPRSKSAIPGPLSGLSSWNCEIPSLPSRGSRPLWPWPAAPDPEDPMALQGQLSPALLPVLRTPPFHAVSCRRSPSKCPGALSYPNVPRLPDLPDFAILHVLSLLSAGLGHPHPPIRLIIAETGRICFIFLAVFTASPSTPPL